MSIPASLSSPAICVPYAQATTHQLILVLTSVAEELGPQFPALDFPSWSKALFQLQPEVWVEQGEAFIDSEDLDRLAQCLAASPELPQPSYPVYPYQACYLARRLVKYQDLALVALKEIEANPHGFGYGVYALILDLAAGNGIAEQVYRVTHRQTPSRSHPDPAAERQRASARIAAVRRAHGELAYVDAVPKASIAAPANPAAETGQ